MKDTIRVCIDHQERPTPLIFTMAFPGAEYWCPFCGYQSGMLGAGERIELTPELVRRAEADEVLARPYLNARAWRSCSTLEYQGRSIKPEELPREEKDKHLKALAEWRLLAVQEIPA
jgi:hypothetical protein